MTEEIKEILYCDMYNDLDDKKYEKILNYITTLQKELDQYKNNWEDLKKWLETKINDYKKYDIDDFTIYQHVLIKMKELEEE